MLFRRITSLKRGRALASIVAACHGETTHWQRKETLARWGDPTDEQLAHAEGVFPELSRALTERQLAAVRHYVATGDLDEVAERMGLSGASSARGHWHNALNKLWVQARKRQAQRPGSA